MDEIYLKGWKISKIVHMFTRPLKCPQGDPDEIRRKRIESKNTTSVLGRLNFV